MTVNDRTTEMIERAADEIRASRLDDATATAASDRVWARLHAELGAAAPLHSCADVQALLPSYIAGELPEARALLVGDHTRECVPCRRALLELRGGGGSGASTGHRTDPVRHLPTWLRVAAAVLLVVAGGIVATAIGGNLVADRALVATVATADGSLQLITDDATTVLAVGDTIRARQHVRTDKTSGAFIRLADGSMIEMAPRSELALRGSRKGTTIALGRGNIIVNAADQGRDRLRVTTNECEVAVKGTIFAVTHGLKGSRVSVIEGEVEVRQGDLEAILLPGDQLTTDQRLQPVDIIDEIAWSANADQHRALLAELTRLQRDVVEAVDVGEPRTSTRLLDLVPADTLLYVAVPNLTEGIGAARQVFSSRLAESEILRDWWQREIVARNIDREIEDSLDRLQFLGQALGDEIVVVLDASVFDGRGTPLVLAELDEPADFRDLLAEHLANKVGAPPPVALVDDPFAAPPAGAEVVIWVADDLVVAGADTDAIRGVAERLAGADRPAFATSALYRRLAERYRDGVEWLVGLDVAGLVGRSAAGSSIEEAAVMQRFGLLDATTLVVERHRSDAGSELDAEVRFRGDRSGVAAWLAEPAPLTTLDFVSVDATLVAAAAAKDGVELFDELLGLAAEAGPDALGELRGFEAELGIDLREDLAAAIGGEGTFAIDGPVLPLPTWKLVLEVYDPATLDATIARVVDRANAELAANGAQPIAVRRTDAGGLRFTSLSHPSSPIAFTYTMTEGYLIAGSSRAAIEQALAVRAGGVGLARSQGFRNLLPDNGFSDCSALVYRNLAPIVDVLPPGAMGEDLGAYEELLRASAAPGLICAYGLGDRILVSGTGPSLTTLAPILGLHGLATAEEIGEIDANGGPGNRLSSQS